MGFIVTLRFPPPTIPLADPLHAISVVCHNLLFLILQIFLSMFVFLFIGFVTHNFIPTVHQSSAGDAVSSGETKFPLS